MTFVFYWSIIVVKFDYDLVAKRNRKYNIKFYR